ncbi:MAG: hypothetical protein HYX48_06040 [Chlamydiales bacterium]|nr:hypothetical protein [Chlamydiales bacterium]
MTTASLTPSQRLNRHFYSWADTIAEYAGSDHPKKVTALVISSFQVQREAQAYITSLTERTPATETAYARDCIFVIPTRLFSSAPTGKDFGLQVFEALTDMAMVPGERALIKAIAYEAGRRSAQVRFEKVAVDLHEQKSEKKSGLNIATQSCAYRRTQETSTAEEIHIVALDTKRTFMSLMVDERGRWHLEKLSLRRTLAHELIHVFNDLTRRYEAFAKLPKTIRWTTAHEEAAISGSCSGAVIEFTENAFARARGELQRVSHHGWEASNSKVTLFLQALQVGASETVTKLVEEWRERRRSEELCKRVRKAAKTVYAALKSMQPAELAGSFPTRTEFLNRATQNVMSSICTFDHFDLDQVHYQQIIDARTLPPLEIQTSSSIAGKEFLEEVVSRRNAVYQNLIKILKSNDRKMRAEMIEQEVEKFNKKREEPSELMPVIEGSFAESTERALL